MADGLRPIDLAVLQLFEPGERAYVELLIDLFPTQAGPLAEIHLPQTWQNGGNLVLQFDQGRQCLLHAFHRAGVNHVKRIALQVLGHGTRLLVPKRRQLHIDCSTKDAVIGRFNFTMADEEKSGWRRHRQRAGQELDYAAGAAVSAERWACSNSPIPSLARATIAASCSSVNVASSPEPCNSTN